MPGKRSSKLPSGVYGAETHNNQYINPYAAAAAAGLFGHYRMMQKI